MFWCVCMCYFSKRLSIAQNLSRPCKTCFDFTAFWQILWVFKKNNALSTEHTLFYVESANTAPLLTVVRWRDNPTTPQHYKGSREDSSLCTCILVNPRLFVTINTSISWQPFLQFVQIFCFFPPLKYWVSRASPFLTAFLIIDLFPTQVKLMGPQGCKKAISRLRLYGDG